MNGQDIDSKYLELAEKWLNGTITTEEETEFFNWYNARQDSPLHVTGPYSNEGQLKHAIWQQIQARKNATGKQTGTRIILIRMAIAACIITLIVSGYLLWLNRTPNANMSRNNQSTTLSNNDIAPGGNKAMLMLADGSVVVLDTAKNGRLADQGLTTILKVDDGKLSYEAIEGNKDATYNTLTTPRGGQYQLVLPDGSQVWLNAASSIRFPTAFTSHERKVTITGEVYFEVAKDAEKPFKVDISGKGEVEVLGTHFNVNAYDDEPTINTTLLEGSVKIRSSTTEEQSEITLQPGEQAIMLAGSPIAIDHSPHLGRVVAWKNGLFVLDNSDINTIMRQVQRWYDVDVVYKGRPVTEIFVGSISRNEPVSKLLRLLELTGTVHFTIEGKTITATP